MTDPLPKLDQALAQLQTGWDDARSERTLGALRRKRLARVRRRVGLGAAAAVALAAAGALLLVERSPKPADPARAAAESTRGPDSSARRIDFADGSHVVLLDADARIVVDAVSPSALAVAMPSGRARFEVVPNPRRKFQVSAGDVVVQVLGTSFELWREGARTHVSVRRGRVAVRWSSGAVELGAGDAGWFPPFPASAVELGAGSEAAAERAPGDRPFEPAQGRRPVAQARGWREHAEDGDFGRAYELLQRDRERVADDVQELLLAADAARLSGHPAQAVPFLRGVIDRHASDPRASLAAFTLGGVLMNQLGRPREAEAAYAQARALSLSDALAQDAVARQVEAAHRAGDTARARELALEYLERYPNGRRVNAVRRFGGLQ